MKKVNIAYGIITGLFLALMLMTAVTSFIPNPDGQAMMKHLGYPYSILIFLSVANILGVIAILVPGYLPAERMDLCRIYLRSGWCRIQRPVSRRSPKPMDTCADWDRFCIRLLLFIS